MNKKKDSPEKRVKKVDLFGPNCDKQLAEALAANASIKIEIPDDRKEKLAEEMDNEILDGNLLVSDIVIIRIKATPVNLATYRDPITRRKVGRVPKTGGRKQSFPYPDASVPNDALYTLQWRFIGCDPTTLRMIAFLAEPGTIQAAGDPKLLKRLIGQAEFTLRAFKARRLREPIKRFISALQDAQRKSSSNIW